MGLYVRHNWGKIGKTSLYSKSRIGGKNGCLSSLLYIVFSPFILIFYFFKFIIAGIAFIIGAISGNKKRNQSQTAPGKMKFFGADVSPVLGVAGYIIIFLAAAGFGMSLFSNPPKSKAEDVSRAIQISEAQELHNPYDDYDFVVYGNMKYIKNNCLAYEIADENSDILESYDIGTRVFVSSYSPQLGWSRIQDGKNHYFVKSKNLTTEVPKSEAETTALKVQKEPEKQKQTEYSLSVSVTSPVKNRGKATATVKGKPGATYSISVYYGGTESTAKGLDSKKADANGNVSWTWTVGSNTTPGTQSVIVRNVDDYTDKKTAYFETTK